MQISWASPLRQVLVSSSSGATSQGHLGVVSLQVHEEEPLRRCAARNAFWSVPISLTLTTYASFVGCDLGDCASDFDTVFKSVRHELDCDDETAIEACRRRQILSQHDRSVDELVKSEDVLELLSKDDQKDLLKHRKTATANKESMKKFSSDLTHRSKEVKARAKAKAGAGNQRKKKKQAAVNPWGGRRYGRIPEGTWHSKRFGTCYRRGVRFGATDTSNRGVPVLPRARPMSRGLGPMGTGRVRCMLSPRHGDATFSGTTSRRRTAQCQTSCRLRFDPADRCATIHGYEH